MARQDLLASQAHLDNKDLQALRVQQDHLERLEHLELQDYLDPGVTLDFRVLLDH